MALKPIAYVQAAWHTEITDHCRTAFMAEIAKHGYGTADVRLFTVPGSLEIPLMAQKLAQTGRYAAVCASGLVVDGGILPARLRGPGRAARDRADLVGDGDPGAVRRAHA